MDDERTASTLRDLKPAGVGGVDRELRLAAVLEVALGRAPQEHRVGRYRVHEKLGEGGMGVVYRCTDPELERDVAIKFLRAAPTHERRARLLAEARALARFSDPHVVTIHDVGVVDGQVYFTMEYAAGGSLADWIAAPTEAGSGRLLELLALFVQAGRGLAAAHDRGLVHRDFKPSNVLIGDDGRARVADFGLVASTDPIVGDATDSDSAGSTLRSGTPAFMSPEQLRGQPVDARSDQYSFGKSLRHCMDRLASHRRGLTRLVRRRVEAVIARTQNENRERRFPSMHQVVDALERATRPRRWPWVGAASLVLLGLGAGLSRGLDRSAAPDPRVACLAGGDALLHSRANAAPEIEAALGTDERGAIVFAALDSDLRDYADRWRDAWQDACDDTWRAGRQSRVALDRRLSCLERRRDYAEAFMVALADAHPSIADRAPLAVASLPDVSVCADVEQLAHAAPELSPTAAADLEPLRRRLATLQARLDLGQLDDLAAVEQEVERALAVDHAPTIAVAQLLEGNLRQRLGVAGAREATRASFVAALRGHDDEAALVSALTLSGQASNADTELAEASFWIETAEAIAARSRPSPVRRAEIAEARGHLARNRNDFASAAEHFGAAIDALADVPGQATARAVLRVSRAQALSLSGQDERALSEVDPALTTMLERLGPGHPYVRATQSTRATILLGLGRFDEARRAYHLLLDDLGADEFERRVALTLNLGELERRAGDLEAAERYTLEAIELLADHDGNERDHRTAYKNLSAIYERQGRYEAALEAVRESVAGIPEATRLTEPQLVYRTRANEVAILIHLGRFAEAEELNTTVLEVLEAQLGAHHIDLLGPSLTGARAAFELGKHGAARSHLARAEEILEQIDGEDEARVRAGLLEAEIALAEGDPTAAERALDARAASTESVGGLLRGKSAFLRARAAWADGRRSAARALATQACADLSAATAAHDLDWHRACVAWREAHP